MKRRQFIAGLGAAAVWPLAARAQQAAMPVVGFIDGGSADASADRVRAFRKGLGETGYVEGRNVAIEYRTADGQYDRLPAMAADLVRRQVTVIAASAISATLAAKAATKTIPIVFSIGGDPVELGLVASLARPGGNITGVTNLNTELGPKRLELLRELVPTATTIAALVNPTSRLAEPQSQGLQAAARTLGLHLHILHASTDRDINTVFATLAELRTGGLVIGSDAFFNTRAEQLAALALRKAVPTIYQFREFSAAGGLMSYGGNNTDNHPLVGTYTGRILKGEKPAELPVQQQARIELIINMKTSKALGLTIPETRLATADEVIQ